MKILSQQTQAAIFFLVLSLVFTLLATTEKVARQETVLNCDLEHFQHSIVQVSLIDFRSNVPGSTSSVNQILQSERITLDS
jgi:hypothetical protein